MVAAFDFPPPLVSINWTAPLPPLTVQEGQMIQVHDTIGLSSGDDEGVWLKASVYEERERGGGGHGMSGAAGLVPASYALPLHDYIRLHTALTRDLEGEGEPPAEADAEDGSGEKGRADTFDNSLGSPVASSLPPDSDISNDNPADRAIGTGRKRGWKRRAATKIEAALLQLVGRVKMVNLRQIQEHKSSR